mmetsp:Transcript_29955/g.89101  ORF Transcript_29955/g.89101 Transcript_29955/m.89101 type:complete len:266 (-) Transcript_29955:1003-1800(-)
MAPAVSDDPSLSFSASSTASFMGASPSPPRATLCAATLASLCLLSNSTLRSFSSALLRLSALEACPSSQLSTVCNPALVYTIRPSLAPSLANFCRTSRASLPDSDRIRTSIFAFALASRDSVLERRVSNSDSRRCRVARRVCCIMLWLFRTARSCSSRSAARRSRSATWRRRRSSSALDADPAAPEEDESCAPPVRLEGDTGRSCPPSAAIAREADKAPPPPSVAPPSTTLDLDGCWASPPPQPAPVGCDDWAFFFLALPKPKKS